MISASLEKNIEMMNSLLPIKESYDLIERRTSVGGKKACFYFVDGFIKDDIMERIMDFFISIEKNVMNDFESVTEFMNFHLPYVEISSSDDYEALINQVLCGPTVFFIDGFSKAIILDLRTYPTRSMQEPQKEQTLRGARDGFVETIVFNTALLRRRVRDENLVFEMTTVGKRSKTDVVIGYIKDLVDKDLLKSIKKQIDDIHVKSIVMGQESIVESLIKKSKFNPFPKVKYTERPDTASASVLEGKIVLIIDNSPNVIILPTTIFDFVGEAGDFYFPPLIGGYLRLVRNLFFLSTILITPLFLFFMNNEGSIPSWLSFIKMDEVFYVPIFIQLLILELAIDGLRIASLNTPSSLASSFSIVGALLLGEFAVKTGWFAPDTILYMSVVAIAGFAQPNVELSYAIKFIRVFLVIMVQLFNLWGLGIGLLLSFILLANTKTINKKGYLYPLIPFDYHQLLKSVLRYNIKQK